MRSPIAFGLALLAASCAHGAAPAPTTAAPAPAAQPSVRFEYRSPKNPDHQAAYDALRQHRALEQFTEVLSVLRLPRTLTIAFAGCDGVSNAWYDNRDATVTFCYEYVAELWKMAAKTAHPNVSLEDAKAGPVAYLLLHETGHAVFDLLKVPVLGREEDAADTFATIVLLRTGQALATRTLKGAAWQYAAYAQGHKPDESDFSDMHGLDSQRYYNILCLAYGSDEKAYAPVLDEGFLPKDRAEGCADEYRMGFYAFQSLIMPSVDKAELEQLRAKYGKKWETGK